MYRASLPAAGHCMATRGSDSSADHRVFEQVFVTGTSQRNHTIKLYGTRTCDTAMTLTVTLTKRRESSVKTRHECKIDTKSMLTLRNVDLMFDLSNWHSITQFLDI